MQELITYLKSQFTNAEIFQSLDKDFICVRHIIGQSNFGKNAMNEIVMVPIYKTEKFHVDTIRLQILTNK